MTGRRHIPIVASQKKRGFTPSGERIPSREAKKPRVQELSSASPGSVVSAMCHAVHQFGLVGGKWYDSKEKRLEQLLQRLPTKVGASQAVSAAVIFVDAASAAAVSAIVQRCRSQAEAHDSRAIEPRKVATPLGRSSAVPVRRLPRKQSSHDVTKAAAAGTSSAVEAAVLGFGAASSFPNVTVAVTGKSNPVSTGNFRYVINYDLPAFGREYLRRLAQTVSADQRRKAPVEISNEQGFVYTFVEDKQLKTKRCRDIFSLLKKAREAAADPKRGGALGGMAKASEFDACLEQLELSDEDDEGDGAEDEEACDCAHCRGRAIGGTSYHLPPASTAGTNAACPGVEVVRLPLRALENLDAAAPFIAPRISGHVCTLICLHCLNVHTPWDGWEHMFASPELGGSLRVVLVLADGASWHDYPDFGTLCAGGVSWIDILDVDSMDKADTLLERLVEHEIALLDGQSERVVLMGMSQGGGQAMLRFLRSQRRLGGWLGNVCHAPVGPHTPRDRDPLLAPGRPLANCDRPIRLLAGEADSCITAGLILRDADLLRDVGGFTDVEVLVQPGFTHAGFKEVADKDVPNLCSQLEGCSSSDPLWRRAQKEVPELLFVRHQLPKMISKIPPRCGFPDPC